MKLHTNTGIEDREEWRAKIMRALQELRSDDSSVVTRGRRDESREDGGGSSTKI
jgi:hypothetical protein